MKLIAPSILSADFTKLGEEIRAVEKAGADWIHIDVMDGHFVPNITIGPMIVEAARRSTKLPLDVHLMIEHPDRYVQDFADAGANLIAVQVETCTHLNRTVHQVRECGCRPGVVLNPSTPVSAVDWVLEDVDFVILMSVNPGFGGQKFIRSILPKISTAREYIDKHNLDTVIVVDGGVDAGNAAEVAAAGADWLVMGTAFFSSDDRRGLVEMVNKL